MPADQELSSEFTAENRRFVDCRVINFQIKLIQLADFAGLVGKWHYSVCCSYC